LPNVASDPVVPRPLRPAPVGGRAGASSAASGSFEGLLDTAPATERPTRPERVSRNRGSERADPNGDRPEAANSAKPIATQQAEGQPKKGQLPDGNVPAEKPAEATQIKADLVPVLTAEFAAAVAPVVAETETEGAAAPKTAEADTAVTTDQSADAGHADVDVAATGNTMDMAPAVIVAVAIPAPATVNPPPVAPDIDPAVIAPVDLQAGPAAPAKAAPEAPLDADALATAYAAPTKQQAAPEAATASLDKAIPNDDSQKAAVPKSAGLTEAPEVKSPALTDRKAEPGKVKPELHAGAARPAETQPSHDPAQPADTPAEPKAPAPRQPQAQAAEHAAPAARTALADRPELPATAAAPAQLNATTPSPFNLAAHIPAPLAMSPLTALRVDAPADNAVPIAGLAVEIVARAQDGHRRFDIRLDPPELGRIDVRLDVDHGGKVTSRLIVERAETLDLLRRDAPQLERALQHAGLNTEGGMEFSLRDQTFANRGELARENTSRLIVTEDEAVAAEAARRGYGRMIGLGGGVDIRV
jgi:flagellar hook-length control protein FliK